MLAVLVLTFFDACTRFRGRSIKVYSRVFEDVFEYKFKKGYTGEDIIIAVLGHEFRSASAPTIGAEFEGKCDSPPSSRRSHALYFPKEHEVQLCAVFRVIVRMLLLEVRSDPSEEFVSQPEFMLFLWNLRHTSLKDIAKEVLDVR
jgi:hypothetical protein